MPLRVGPYYDGTESDMLTIDTTQCRTRKPSVELLESVHLRPTYVRWRYYFVLINYRKLMIVTNSFPSPRCGGRTPTLPAFRFPQYGYSSVDEYENSDGEQGILNVYVCRNKILYWLFLVLSDTAFSPKSFIDENGPISRQVTVLGGIINCTSFFMGVVFVSIVFFLSPLARSETKMAGGDFRTTLCAETLRLVRVNNSCGSRFYYAIYSGTSRQMPIQILIGFVSRYCRGYWYLTTLTLVVLMIRWVRLPLVPREE